MPAHKYRPFTPVRLNRRTWPDRVIAHAPTWCSVDLRNGNQALVEPYLPIDPADVGRTYEAVIRINSQSGKGGVAHVLERDGGYRLPRGLQVEFSRVIQEITDCTGKEISVPDILKAFADEYLDPDPFELVEHRSVPAKGGGGVDLTAVVRTSTTEQVLRGQGNGPIDAFVDALRSAVVDLSITDYSEHAADRGADATAVAYVEVETGNGDTLFGVGRHPSIVVASLRAVLSAANRVVRRENAASVA